VSPTSTTTASPCVVPVASLALCHPGPERDVPVASGHGLARGMTVRACKCGKCRSVTTRRGPGARARLGASLRLGKWATSGQGRVGPRGGGGTVSGDYHHDGRPRRELRPRHRDSAGAGERGSSGSARVSRWRASRRLCQRARHTAGRVRRAASREGRHARGQVRRPFGSKSATAGGTARPAAAWNDRPSGRTGKKGGRHAQNLLIALTAWLFRAVARRGILVAGLVRRIVRRCGRNAAGTAPGSQARRLGLIPRVAIVCAAAVWARMHNTAFEGIYNLTAPSWARGNHVRSCRADRLAVQRHPDRTRRSPAEDRWNRPADRRARLLHHREGVPTLSKGVAVACGQDRRRPGRHGRSWPLDKGDGLGGDAAAAWWPAMGCSSSGHARAPGARAAKEL